MLYLRTFGGAALEHDGVPLDNISAQRKSLALLVLLAAARQQGISRDRLAAYLWPDSDTERARGALKQMLHGIRRQLDFPHAILGSSDLRLNPEIFTSDVDAFLTALEKKDLGAAAELYTGPFLEGFYVSGASEFERWASAQRDELAHRYAASVESLATAAEQRGDYNEAVRWWRRVYSEDPLSGWTTARLMRALDAAGQRAAALRCAQLYEVQLKEEFGSPPDPAVVALAARIRSEPQQRSAVDETPLPAAADAGMLPRKPTLELPKNAPAARPPRVRRKHALFLLAAAATLTTIIAYSTRRAATAAPSANPSIAVLPFTGDGDSADAHLTDGLADELTRVLGRISGLRVAERASSAALHAGGIGGRAVAESLGVAAYLHGTFSRSGDRIAVATRLVDVRNGRTIWSRRLDGDIADVVTMQEEIARGVAGALGVSQVLPGGAPLVGRSTTDVEAYDLFLRGRHSWKTRSREGFEQAVLYYEQAVERDPAFAAAYAGLAEAYVNLSNFGYRPVSQSLARAKVAAERAIQLDPRRAEAHAALAFVLASELDFAASEEAFRRAIALNPSYAWARHYYTLLLLMLDRTDEGMEQNRAALEFDPLSIPANATRGIILAQRRAYADAERELRRALALSPDFPLTLHYLGVVRAAQGAYDDALTLLQRAARHAPDFTGVPAGLAYLYARTGRVQVADSILAALRTVGGERALANLAFTYAALGRRDSAFALFDRMRWDIPSMIELRADPLLAPIRSDPRYAALIGRLESPRR